MTMAVLGKGVHRIEDYKKINAAMKARLLAKMTNTHTGGKIASSTVVLGKMDFYSSRMKLSS